MDSDSGTASTSNGPVGQGEYVVEPGDCAESIAFANGLFWRTLWDDPQNADVKQARKDPNVLLPGDRLHIPEKRLKDESGATEQRHRFKLKGVPAQLRLKMCEDGVPRKNVAYDLWIDGVAFKGSTDDEGMVIHFLLPNAREARLRLDGDPQDYTIKLGHLDPVESAAGYRARLRNVGYNPGDEEGEASPETIAALRSFQSDNGLDATGQPDQKTLDKLQSLHGS